MGARFSCSLLSCAKNLFEQANLGPWCWRRFRVVPVQHLHQSAQAWKILLRPRSAHSIQMRDQKRTLAFDHASGCCAQSAALREFSKLAQIDAGAEPAQRESDASTTAPSWPARTSFWRTITSCTRNGHPYITLRA